MRNGMSTSVSSNIVMGALIGFEPPSTVPVELLIVGGGGAGGTIKYYATGGGGGGGAVIDTTTSLLQGASITVSIGAGGNGTSIMAVGEIGKQDGLSTVFDGFTAKGGAGGAWMATYDGNISDSKGRNTGGSTGGAAALNSNATGSQTPYSTLTQTGNVNIGGSAFKNATGNGAFVAGGGGGAGQIGGDGASNAASGSYGGKGGDGYSSSITGVAVWYGAGGGGGLRYASAGFIRGLGGAGGGGDGAVGNQAGFNATGYGCGGGGASNGDGTNPTIGWAGGNGSAGVVIIAYPSTYPILTISAGLVYDQPATRAGWTVYRITSGSGTVQMGFSYPLKSGNSKILVNGYPIIFA